MQTQPQTEEADRELGGAGKFHNLKLNDDASWEPDEALGASRGPPQANKQLEESGRAQASDYSPEALGKDSGFHRLGSDGGQQEGKVGSRHQAGWACPIARKRSKVERFRNKYRQT